MSHRVHIKMCGIGTASEVVLGASFGADALGFVPGWATPGGQLDDAMIGALTREVPEGIWRVLLTQHLGASEMVAQAVRCGADVIQICDHVPVATRLAVRAELPDVRLLQVVHMGGDVEMKTVRDLAESSDGLLLDSGVSGTSFSERGGTGRVHDWAKSRAVVEAVTTPVWLAGGLRAENVSKAVEQVRPYGVDVCSGLRAAGGLSARRIRQFMDTLDASGTRTG